MTTPVMRVDQAQPPGTSVGTPGIARNDLWQNQLCTATSINASGSYLWTLWDKPRGSSTVLSATNTQTITFTPDTWGTYRLGLSLDGGTTWQILVFRVRYSNTGVLLNRGWVMPAFGEEGSEANYAGNDRGYDEPWRFIIDDLLSVIAGLGSNSLGGDLSGTTANATVTKIQGYAVEAVAPNDGDTLVWSSAHSRYEPAPAVVPSLAGDTSGPSGATVTSRLRGAAIATAAGALVVGTILRVTGASNLDYGALDLANTNAVTNQLPGSKVVPNFGAQDLTARDASVRALTATSDVIVQGNLTVQGTTTTVDSTTVDIEARVIHGHYAPIGNVPVPSAITGFEIERGDTGVTRRDAAAMLWDETNQLWQFAFQTAANDTAVGALLPVKAASFRAGATVASRGDFRSANATTVLAARNAANSDDISVISTDNTNRVVFGDSALGASTVVYGGTANNALTLDGSAKTARLSQTDVGGLVLLDATSGVIIRDASANPLASVTTSLMDVAAGVAVRLENLAGTGTSSVSVDSAGNLSRGAAPISPSSGDTTLPYPNIQNHHSFWWNGCNVNTGLTVGTGFKALSQSGSTVVEATPSSGSKLNGSRRVKYSVTSSTSQLGLFESFNGAGSRYVWIGDAAGRGGFKTYYRFAVVSSGNNSKWEHHYGLDSTNGPGFTDYLTDTTAARVMLVQTYTATAGGAIPGGTNWQFSECNGTTNTLTNTGIPVVHGNIVELFIYCAAHGVVQWILNDLTAGTTASGSCTTSPPINTLFMAPSLHAAISVAGTGTCEMDAMALAGEMFD